MVGACWIWVPFGQKYGKARKRGCDALRIPAYGAGYGEHSFSCCGPLHNIGYDVSLFIHYPAYVDWHLGVTSSFLPPPDAA